MRVIVCGSRGWQDSETIAARLASIPDPGSVTIVHGGAKGADRIAKQEAKKAGMLVESHYPDYDTFSPNTAPLERNEKMASLGADLCIAFWDGNSRGTAHMINRAHRHGIPVEVIRPSAGPDG